MASELLQILEYIENERGISRELLVKALENALLTASKKSIHPAKDLKVKVDPTSGRIQAWAKLEVVESLPNNDQLALERAKERFPEAQIGDIIEWEVTPRNFGRIAAQTARQAIMQQLRKAEKEIAMAEFSGQEGQILNGIVRRFDNGNIIIDFHRAEGLLSAKDKLPGEQYMPGEHINALLVRIDLVSSGPSLIVSRVHPDFVRRLFEREVAEIHDGVVEIMSVARESGSRTKIAVRSNDPRIDAVGSCVGIRGNRVRNVTDELNNERIDIVPYDEDIRKFAANALSPATVLGVDVDEENHELTIHVSPEQSKLAFGKKAQNVRLSGRLIGWTITLKTEGESAPRPEQVMADKIRLAADEMMKITGLDEKTALLLINNGYVTSDGLKAAGLQQLLEIPEINGDAVRAALAKLEMLGE